MAAILEEDLGFLYRKIVRGKDKNRKFLKQREFHLEVKKTNTVMEDAQPQPLATETYITISNDVWYHVSRFVEPEDVQRFALICQDTAALVRTKSFWKNIFVKYCQKFGAQIWIVRLPAHLQLHNIRDYGPRLFRTSVIEALFYCYTPFQARLDNCTLDLLVGKDYISAWQRRFGRRMWIMCYRFQQHGASLRNTSIDNCNIELVPTELVNDWESLADDNDNVVLRKSDEDASNHIEESNPYEGVCLLVIFAQRFIPFESQISYARGEQAAGLRLSAVRRPLTRDMREYNLELDFIDTISKTTTTIKYPTVSHSVLPWWHPDFTKYVKFEPCDKFS